MKTSYVCTPNRQIPQYEVEVLAADSAWSTYKRYLGLGHSQEEAAQVAGHAYDRSVRDNPYSAGRIVDVIRKLESFDTPFNDHADGTERYRDPSHHCGQHLSLKDLSETYELALNDTHCEIEASLCKSEALENHRLPIWRDLYDRICAHYPDVARIPVAGTKDIRHIVHGCTSKFSIADIRYFLAALQGKPHPMEQMRRLRIQHHLGYHLGWRMSDASLEMIESALGL